jgi:hypothetical protein
MLNRTRISLFYLGFYLVIIGFGLRFAPHGTLTVLQSNGDYGGIFPRVTGMFYERTWTVCFRYDSCSLP